jgi:hypothetical protein
MPLDGPGCGVPDHTPDCLCDVHVTEPVSVMDNWVRDSFMIAPLLERMGDVPWGTQGVLELLSKQLDVHDDMEAYEFFKAENPRSMILDNAGALPPRVRLAVVQMSKSGIPHPVIRSHIRERYDYVLSASRVARIMGDYRRNKRRSTINATRRGNTNED